MKSRRPAPQLGLSLLLASSLVANAQNSNATTDPSTGLIIAPGWELVRTNCTVCHSARFITFQRGDRETWAAMIEWMQKTQGLWQFDPATQDSILGYLASNYPPGKPARRKNLPPADLPATPP